MFIKCFLQAGLQSAVVILSVFFGIRLIAIPECGQVFCEIVTQMPINVLQNPLCTRDSTSFSPLCQKGRLVGEDSFYCFAEEGFEFIVVALVNETDETGHRLGI